MADWDRVMTTLMVERGGALKRYAYLLCGDDTVAEDLLQEALVRVLSRARHGSDPERLEAYLRKTLVNLCIDRYRGMARWRRLLPRLAAVPGLEPDPSAAVVARSAVRTALEALSPRQRACIVLRFYEDLSVTDIAAVLGCSQGAVKRHLSDATGRMLDAYERGGDERCSGNRK